MNRYTENFYTLEDRSYQLDRLENYVSVISWLHDSDNCLLWNPDSDFECESQNQLIWDVFKDAECPKNLPHDVYVKCLEYLSD